MTTPTAIVGDCPHGRPSGKCLRCDNHRYDDTCWYCGRVMKVDGCIVGGGRVHKRCKAKAEKYEGDTA
ncbi:MAG: hypothetical protein E6Q97_05430 [Desulfurellales bacterium]|nr:MAG: hypothetical protein E6Q97_05430 [Desulfurellales bacterium]